jgi:hypothetical protein
MVLLAEAWVATRGYRYGVVMPVASAGAPPWGGYIGLFWNEAAAAECGGARHASSCEEELVVCG